MNNMPTILQMLRRNREKQLSLSRHLGRAMPTENKALYLRILSILSGKSPQELDNLGYLWVLMNTFELPQEEMKGLKEYVGNPDEETLRACTIALRDSGMERVFLFDLLELFCMDEELDMERRELFSEIGLSLGVSSQTTKSMEKFFASLACPQDLLKEKTLPFSYMHFCHILDLRALIGEEGVKEVLEKLDKVFILG